MKFLHRSIGRMKQLVALFSLLVIQFSSPALAVSDPTFNYALFGTTGVTMTGGSFTDSYVGMPSSYVRGQYKNGDIATNSLAPCGIKISGGTQVYGKALVGYGGNAGTGVCISGGSSIFNNNVGLLPAAKNMTPRTMPSGGSALGAYTLSNGAKNSLAAGSYRLTSLNLAGGSTLTLNGQVDLYIEGNMTISNGATLAISSGPVTIYMSGQTLNITGGAITNTMKDPSKLTIYGTSGLKTINLSGGTNLYAHVFSPAAAIIMSGGQNTYGSLIGGSINLLNGSSVHFDGGASSDTTPATITIVSPLSGARLNSMDVNVSGSVSEAVSSVVVNGSAAAISGTNFSAANTALVEGANTIRVTAVDLAGNSSTASVNVTRDMISPAAPVLEKPLSPVNMPQIVLNGSAEADSTIKVYKGGVLIGSTTANGQGGFTLFGVTLTEGANSYSATASDLAGNTGQVSSAVSVTLDSIPPAAPLLIPVSTPTKVATITVSGMAEALASVKMFNGASLVGTVSVDVQGKFTLPNVTLTEGQNILIAQVVDAAGDSGAVSSPLQVILDTRPPVITITAPANGLFLNAPAVTITGSIDDPTAQVTVNGLAASISGATFSDAGVPLTEGANTLTVTAVDPAGNQATASVSVTLDTNLPLVAITAPIEGSFTSIPSVAISGTVSEAPASVLVNGRPADLNGTAYTLAGLTLAEGSNTVTVEALDKAGNKGTAIVTVILDTVNPVITISVPVDLLLTRNPQLTVSGSLSEQVAAVTVNGAAVAISSTHPFTFTSTVTLAEGDNNISVEALDYAGNEGTAAVGVNLDSTAPQAPLLAPLATPTRTATVSVSGQAEPLSQVRLFNNGQQVAQLTADAGGMFTVANVILTEGSNPFTAQAVDAAGNASQPSAPLTVVLDTRPPVITVTAPQSGLLVSAPQVVISGTVDEALASMTVNGGVSALIGTAFEYVLTLAAGENSALITATDPAGNVATTTVTVMRDSTPPRVTISAPLNGLLTNSPQIQVSGSVDDAEVTLSVGGAPATITNKSFSVAYLLTDGENSIQGRAVDNAGNEGTAAVQVILDAQPPAVTLAAPAAATAGTDVQIGVSATDNRGLSLVDLSADGASLWSAAPNISTAGQSVSLRLSPMLNSGATVTLRARALDAAGNSGSATAVITIDKGADGPGWLQGKVLDDNRGLLLEGAQIQVTDVKGQQQSFITPADGGWFFELASGPARVEVLKNGFTAVRRDVTVRPGQRTTVLDSRLTRIDSTLRLVDGTGGTVRTALTPVANSPSVDLTIPANALSTRADLRLTLLSNQGLIAPLPLGWSPLAVAELRLLDPLSAAPLDPQPLTAPAVLTLPLPKGLGDTSLAAQLARYDGSDRSWRAVAEVAIAANAASVNAQISQPGQYALLLADPAPAGPVKPAAGAELAAAPLAATDFSTVSSTGRVVPQAALPSVGLRAAGDLWLTANADATTPPALSSGLVVNARITERFDLTSGDRLQPNATLQDIVLYRTPCATAIAAGASEPFVSADGLRSTFPVAPSRDFTIVDLLLGKISIAITPPDTSGGVMVGADGARLLQPDGTALSIPVGALSGTAPVTVATLSEAGISSLVGADFRLLCGVDIAIGGQLLKNTATLSIPAPAGFNPSLPVVVARKFDVKVGSRLKLVGSGKPSGSIISSDASVTAANGTTATQGITTSGQYLFLQAVSPIGYLGGQITDAAAAPFAGIQVSAQGATLTDVTSANGQYLLALAAGEQSVTALDPSRGDAASATAAISANANTILNLTVRMLPPQVAAIIPANGVSNVQPAVPVTVTFSKAMDKNSITSATLVVRDAASTIVPGVITWNAEATVATYYPADAFRQETGYSITIAATVKDLQGYPLGQDVRSGFTVRRTTPPVMPPAGNVSGTFPDADGFITVTATQGSAEAGNTVLLINDTTGEIQSVTPASNGSFTGKVRGQLGDQIKVVLMDHSGNQTVISYITFRSPNGSYLVTAKGGKVEGEGGSLLDIPDGALVGAAIVRLTRAAEENLPYPIPDKGNYLGAFNIDTGGINFQKEVHLSIPVPDGFDTNTAVFVTRPSSIYNGDDTTEQVYEIVDSTKVVNGRITTASPPFDGIFASGNFAFVAFPTIEPVILSGYAYQEMNDLGGYQEPPDGLVETPTVDITTGILTYRYDRPVAGAVIRSPWALNYVSYSNSKGFYATFSSLIAGAGLPCKDYTVSATNPYTMQRRDIKGQLCEPPNNVERFNFKLGEKGTLPPDKTNPIIEATIKVAAGQDPEYRIVSGTVPINTKLLCPVSVTDEGIRSTTLVVNFKGDAGASGTTPVSLVRPPASVIVRNITRGIDVPVYRTDFITQFNSDPTMNYFLADQPGVYTFVVEATDHGGNSSSLSRSIRVAAPGGVLPTGREGAPGVDRIEPLDGSKNVAITEKVTIWFSEPVDNVTDTTVKLLDMTASPTGTLVPATVGITLDGNRTVATLTPKSVLWSSHTYKVVVTQAIKDSNPNRDAPFLYAPPTGDGKMPLDREYTVTFSTPQPLAYDLEQQERFSGGRDVAVYEFRDNNGIEHAYAYVAAGDQGWRVVDVTDPSEPYVVTTHNMTNNGVSWSMRGINVSQENKLLAVTENTVWSDGNQAGYIRFYNLAADARNPPLVGREQLSEAYSGIPGRVVFVGNYAYVANAALGIQVIDAAAAIERQKNGGASNGSSIVGVFDTMGQGYSSPSDVMTYGNEKALVTTNSGYLLVLDITTPYYPILMNPYRPPGYSFNRVAELPQYTYTDSSGNEVKLDLAVAGTIQNKIVTLDLSDAYNPRIIGTVTDDNGRPVDILAYDISIVKEEAVAYITTLNAIVVIDIKDPTNPKLRNRYDTLPVIPPVSQQQNGTTPQPQNQAVAPTPAIAVRDGWILMANQANGLRSLGVNPNDIKVYDENKRRIAEIEYSRGERADQRYNIEIIYDDESIECNNNELDGNVVIRTRTSGVVNPLAGIDHPTKYLMSFRKGTDGHCYADLKPTLNSVAKSRFIATNFPASDPTLATALPTVAPIFGSIGTKAVFEFSDHNTGKLLKRKSIPLEKLIRIAFDGNRDGKIEFNNPDDIKYTFWVNEDHDVEYVTANLNRGTTSEYDDMLNTTLSDAGDDVINSLRDLEDFAPLQMQIDVHARQVIKRLLNPALPSPKFTYHLQFKNTNGANPAINLFEAVGKKTMLYLQDQDTAKEQINKTRIVTVDAANEANLPTSTLKDEDVSKFIFEGKSNGFGDLTITLKLNGVFVDDNTVNLNLKPIRWFYDKHMVEFDGATSQVRSTVTNSRIADYVTKADDYVFYVHGWNMSNGEDEKERWTETMFKRLWWQGYSGRVVLFSWPTLEGALTFDESEFRAWNSAEAFKNLLLSSDMQKYHGKIRILGHSMGGIVSGETIKKLTGPGIIKSYIATQAALSSNFYDNNQNEPSWASTTNVVTTPNVYGYYFSGSATSSNKPYLIDSLKNAEFINYYNKNDYALTAGALGYFGWEMNNMTKTDSVFGYGYEKSLNQYFYQPLLLVRELVFEADRYEIFSRITQSRVKALGATTHAIEGFTSNKNKDLSLLKYDGEHYSHSKQFRSTIIEEWGYWNNIMTDFELSKY